MYLYRCFDKNKTLLYVGISSCIEQRLLGHKSRHGLTSFRKLPANRKWFHRLESVVVEEFSSRTEAADAERRAIKTEKPLFNVKLNTLPAPRKKDAHLRRIPKRRPINFY